MAVTIRHLIADGRLGLRVVFGHEGLDQPIRWVAVSELPDPAPWLDGAELLLTSGMWLREELDRTRAADQWAGRLVEAGARAVGFGLDPWYTAIPDEIMRAIQRWRLTLIEIPPRTPFVAVDRAVADLNAEQARREAEHAGRVQQRLAEAGHSGPQAVVERLAREVRGWAAVLDTRYEVVMRAPDGAGPPDEELVALACRGDEAGWQRLNEEIGDTNVAVVPIGLPPDRRGTLCAGAHRVGDRRMWSAGIVGTAAALLTVLDRGGERELRGIVAKLLAGGDPRSAAGAAAAAGLELPAEVSALVLVGPGHRPAAARVVGAGGWPVTDDTAESLVIVPGEVTEDRLLPLLAGVEGGLSRPHAPDHVPAAVHEARQAAGSTAEGHPLTRYADTPGMELDRLILSPPAQRFAAALLTPVTREDDADLLLSAARHWVEANHDWDAAAGAAGSPTGTLRDRVGRLAGLAGLDLDHPPDRLALALALTVGFPPPPPPGEPP